VLCKKRFITSSFLRCLTFTCGLFYSRFSNHVFAGFRTPSAPIIEAPLDLIHSSQDLRAFLFDALHQKNCPIKVQVNKSRGRGLLQGDNRVLDICHLLGNPDNLTRVTELIVVPHVNHNLLAINDGRLRIDDPSMPVPDKV
jgi:hypothetical protein